jgi:hypothetical protein
LLDKHQRRPRVEDYESDDEDREELDGLDECNRDDNELAEDLAQEIYDQIVEECECEAISLGEYPTFLMTILLF